MQHSEKSQRPAEHKSASQPLKIDAPNSAHEKEAETVAEKVSRNGQILGSENSMSGQIGGNPDPKNGMIAPGGVKEQISSTKGSGDKLPDSVKRMMKGKSGELDDVRIHTDSKAAELSESVNAKAFTHGKDIYFGQGLYDTYSSEGKELLAHEIAHAKENTSTTGDHIIQRELQKVSTAWGTFEELWVEPYTKIAPPEYPVHGLGMYMKFTAKDPTDAEKIGLVQITKGYENGHTGKGVMYPNQSKTRKEHAIKAEVAVNSTSLNENEEGFHIDQDKGEVNPLYAVTESELGQTLSEGKTGEPVESYEEENNEGETVTRYKGFGKHGKYYSEENGTRHDEPAELRDFPYFSVKPNHEGGVVLETAALALEGNQKGRYYGSVKWGWSVAKAEEGKDPVLTPQHITLASSGAASTTFFKAANMWNADRDKSNVAKVIELPVPEFYETTKTTDFYSGVDFSTDSKTSVDSPFRVEKMATDKLPPETNPTLILVRVLEGDLAGVTGWIDGGALQKENISVTKPE